MRGCDLPNAGGVRALRFLGESPFEVGAISITQHVMSPEAVGCVRRIIEPSRC